MILWGSSFRRLIDLQSHRAPRSPLTHAQPLLLPCLPPCAGYDRSLPLPPAPNPFSIPQQAPAAAAGPSGQRTQQAGGGRQQPGARGGSGSGGGCAAAPAAQRAQQGGAANGYAAEQTGPSYATQLPSQAVRSGSKGAAPAGNQNTKT